MVLKAREMGLAGASVFTAEMGYGCHRVVHDLMSDYAFMETPLVVEVIDSEERIKDLLTEFKAMVGEGLVTVAVAEAPGRNGAGTTGGTGAVTGTGPVHRR